MYKDYLEWFGVCLACIPNEWYASKMREGENEENGEDVKEGKRGTKEAYYLGIASIT